MNAMCEIDEFEAAAKRMRMKEQATIDKQKRKMMLKNDGVQFKDEENPYDSEELEYQEAAKK
jgi:hypothetical protein